jgi:hypothetical protein
MFVTGYGGTTDGGLNLLAVLYGPYREDGSSELLKAITDESLLHNLYHEAEAIGGSVSFILDEMVVRKQVWIDAFIPHKDDTKSDG